jgi:phenylpropionate dioxygenase-like ring-hydroxylating dioxygenase large terminal subunit
MNWKILVDAFHEGYHIGFLHRDSLTEVLHGNVTDFKAFCLNHRLVMPRKKLERPNGGQNCTPVRRPIRTMPRDAEGLGELFVAWRG